ncbi:MAG: protein DpdD [Pseudonocardiaceae bacterium]
MTVPEALQRGLGDPARFGSLRERVEFLVDEQVRTWAAHTSDWLVVPIQRSRSGFYLLSEDREGQRRGREVLQAFLGPATAVIESVEVTPGADEVDRLLQAAGLVHLSHVQRTDVSPEVLLDRLEDAVATLKSRDARLRPLRPSHVDVLRDFRLALLHRDGQSADRALEVLRLTGQLSAENLRFLTIEMLGCLGRWREVHDLPYLPELLRARRPRAINEILLEMLWRTEVADLCAMGHSASDVHAQADLGARYGAVLSAVDVPAGEAGRAVGVVAARALGDSERLQRLLHAAEEGERERLHQLATLGQPATPGTTTAHSDVQGLFDEGQYGAVVRAFLELSDPASADVAVQAALEGEDSVHAPAVLATVQGFIAEQQVHPDRRLLRDLEDLTRLADGSCSGWVEWCSRLGRDERWADAAAVLRSQYEQWNDLSLLAPAPARAAAEDLLSAWAGINQDQLVAGIDVLCRAAAATAAATQTGDFCDAVLLVLAEQQNLSAPVREAYLLLLEQLLDNGPAPPRYRETLQQAGSLWRRVAAPAAFDWGTGLVDVLLNAPTPLPEVRDTVVTEVLNKARDFQQRLSLRQRCELEALAEEAGLHVGPVPTPAEPDQVWSRLNGMVVGVYSLLPHAAESLAKRLSRLCSPRAVEGNDDKVDTTALRTLATRADYLIVDTWHATHAATAAIDTVRPKSQQILPRGRGITAFLQALELAVDQTALVRS